MARAIVITVIPSTSVGIIQEALDCKTLRQAPEHKPWRLPELVINSLSDETSEHYRIPYSMLPGFTVLQHSDKDFIAEEDFYLDISPKQR